MFLRLLRAYAFAAFIILLGGSTAWAEKRVALVIGNSNYGDAGTLINPTRDAIAIADMFRKAQFDVVEERDNLDNQTLHRVVRKFATKVRDADVAVVYYAGHGIQFSGKNYLIPVDALIENDQDIEEETLSLDRVLETLKSAKRLRVVILDACRDNPFEKKMVRSASRAYSIGLAIVEPTLSNTVIAFAAKGGTTADDGNGAHSPFTTALLDKLMTPGVDIRMAFAIVQAQVKKATGGEQEPFTLYSLDGAANIELVPAEGRMATMSLPPSQPTLPPPAIDRDYDRAEHIGTPAAWDSFLEIYDGLPQAKLYLKLARAAREKAIKLEKQKEEEREAKLKEEMAAAEQRKKAEEAQLAEAAHRKAEEARRQAEARAEAERKQAALRAETARKQTELAEVQRAEQSRNKAALAAAAEAARKNAELTKAAELARKAELAKAAEDTRRKAEDTRRAELARRKTEQALRAEQARREAEIVKRVENERKKTLVASASPTAPMRTSSGLLESKAQEFLDDYIKQSQGGLEDLTAYTKRAYAADVDYFGSRLRNVQIVHEQVNYVKTWPERTFQVRPGTTRISCDAANSACDLTGEIDFHDVNPAKAKSSTGVASFQLRVSFAQSEPKIVSENGKVLSRQK